jgi:hypothetical protein
LYFAIGRTTRSTVEKFDESEGNFREEPLDTSPYTHCILLWDLGIVAIAHKPKLASRTQGVAQRLRALLERTDEVIRNGITVEVRPVPDPRGFVEVIQSAYSVQRFTATFRGPNPVDADELFQKPLAQIAAVTAATEGQVRLKSPDLDRDALTSIARNTAATGNTASARVRDNTKVSARTVKMEGSPVELSFQEDQISNSTIAVEVRRKYEEIKGND